jgi:hypothetical protein
MYQGFVGAIFGIASVAGPLLGVSISYDTLRVCAPILICPTMLTLTTRIVRVSLPLTLPGGGVFG